jgi:NADH:ubiquinone oxidoreductase subunit E
MPHVELEKVEPLLEQYEPQRINLIPILQEVQETYRYLPQEVLRKISQKLRVPLTEVYQVATFYRCFSLVPRGKHVIQVCLGTACHVRGAPRVLDRILLDLKMGGRALLTTCSSLSRRCGALVAADWRRWRGWITRTRIPT